MNIESPSIEQESQLLNSGETKLQTGRDLLTEVLQIAQMAYWEYDVPNDQFTFNDQFYSLFRTTAEAVGGYCMSSRAYAQRFVHPDDLPMVGVEIQKAIETTDPNYQTQVDHRILRADGNVGYVSVRIRIEKDESGKTIRTHGVNQDVTERMLLEHQQTTMVAGLRADMEIADELIAAPDLDTLYRRAVELPREKLGLERCALFIEDADGKIRGTYGTDKKGDTTDEYAQIWHKDSDWMERFALPPAQAPRWIVSDAPRLEWDGVKTVKVGLGWVAITPLWIRQEPIGYFVNDAQITNAPIDPAKQENLSIYCSLLGNIIERKRADVGKQQSERLFRALFELSPDAVVLIDPSDPDGVWPIVDCNAAACSMNGYEHDELIGQSIDILNASPASITERQAYTDQIRQSGIFKYEILHRHKDGTIYPIEVSTRFIHVGERELLIGIDRDITRRKQAEEKMARQAEELRRNNEELGRLFRASGSLITGAALNPQEEAQNIVMAILQEFGQSNCSLFVVTPESNSLLRLASAGAYTKQVRSTNLSVDGPGLVPYAVQSGEAVNVGNVKADPRYVTGWGLAQSELAIPLKINGDVIGAIDIQSPEPNAFSLDDERLLSIFAERAALGLERSRLNLQTETRVRQLTALRTIDMAISSSFDIQLTLGVLLDQVIGQLGVHAADILIFNESARSFQLASQRGLGINAAPMTRSRQMSGHAWQVVRERKTVIISDPQEEKNAFLQQRGTAAAKFAVYVGVPLIAKGEVKGVLEIYQREPLQPNPEWTGFLEMLAGQAAIAIDNVKLFDHLQESNSELSLAYDSTLEGWANALELRDHDTAGHTRRTTELTLEMARALGIKESEWMHISRGALLHDIGKMGVPDSIILKPGPLTEAEWEVMRKHPQYAFDLLSPIAFLKPALDIPYCHHEKWDGSGYPRRLAGEQIPLAARIFAVVDVWDALTSDRPYRQAWAAEKALDHIQEQSGKHFDPGVVDAFLRLIGSLDLRKA